MSESMRRNLAILLGVAVTGMIFSLAAPAMRMPNGAATPSLLQAQSPVLAVLAVLGCGAVGLAIACLVGRMVNAVVGLFVLGTGLFMLARRTGSFQELAMNNGSQSMLVIEALIWAGLVLAATIVVFKVAGPLQDIEPEPDGRRPNWWRTPEAYKSAGAAVLVLPVVYVIAQSPAKGQVLAAVILGAMAAGLGGRLLSPHVQPKLLFASVCVFAAVGYVVGMIMSRGPIDLLFVNRTFSSLSLPMPVDYAAGALLGVSMGLGWAKSFLHHEDV